MSNHDSNGIISRPTPYQVTTSRLGKPEYTVAFVHWYQDACDFALAKSIGNNSPAFRVWKANDYGFILGCVYKAGELSELVNHIG